MGIPNTELSSRGSSTALQKIYNSIFARKLNYSLVIINVLAQSPLVIFVRDFIRMLCYMMSSFLFYFDAA